MSDSSIFFMECQNSSCGLRFSLDLALFDGKFCPRCGGTLRQDSPRVKGQSFGVPGHEPQQLVGVLDNLRSAHNVGSIFRSAEGAGFSQLILCGITPSPDINPAIAKTALGAEKMLDWHYTPNAPQALTALKQSGIRILVLESAPSARSLYALTDLAEASDQRIALVVGNEPAGVDPKVIALADECLYLPMSGQKQSLNVAIAFSIAAYHLRFASR